MDLSQASIKHFIQHCQPISLWAILVELHKIRLAILSRISQPTVCGPTATPILQLEARWIKTSRRITHRIILTRKRETVEKKRLDAMTKDCWIMPHNQRMLLVKLVLSKIDSCSFFTLPISLWWFSLIILIDEFIISLHSFLVALLIVLKFHPKFRLLHRHVPCWRKYH